MFKQFFPNLSQNYIEILKDDEYYDITIEVGEDPNSLDFTSLSGKSLVSLIKRDDFTMKEIEIWDHVLKWGLEKNSTLLPDPTTCLSSEDFFQKVRSYKNFLKCQLYEELLESYLNPNSEPNNNILLPRSRNMMELLIRKYKYAYARELYLPYKFKLLLRGSRDWIHSKKFHELCDDKLYTVTFIKVKGTEEIIGGYNPLVWKSDVMTQRKYNYCHCEQSFYERKIRDTGNGFSIEDYEVFQIIRKTINTQKLL
ncbi:unnamed protein product [Rhizophagus irregularis]|nr:unnamed protein product [Rhizophagus irregularis]